MLELKLTDPYPKTLYKYSLTFNGPFIRTYSFYIQVCPKDNIFSSIKTHKYRYMNDTDDTTRQFAFDPFWCSDSNCCEEMDYFLSLDQKTIVSPDELSEL